MIYVNNLFGSKLSSCRILNDKRGKDYKHKRDEYELLKCKCVDENMKFGEKTNRISQYVQPIRVGGKLVLK